MKDTMKRKGRMKKKSVKEDKETWKKRGKVGE